ncbi:MAG: hypothetical protein JWM68_4738 [Verrucomicrobiales bacterium]|nr:hypothetical protein [Verrucomicrobiales bacterium]
MPERYERILKWVCVALAALLVVQLTRVVIRANPLRNVVIPAPPHLDTKSAGPESEAKRPGGETVRSNAVSSSGENRKTTNAPGTVQTNSVKSSSTNTTVVATSTSAATNVATSKTNSATVSTNSVVSSNTNRTDRHAMPTSPSGTKSSELPAIVQSRVSRIVDSELFAPVVRPIPAALIGIGADRAFLRSSSGQTGMVKEGEEVGGMKLLQIGTNRVLVEESGEKKELTIFAGIGGESLLPKERKDK